MNTQDVIEKFGESILEDFYDHESIAVVDDNGDSWVLTKVGSDEFEMETYYA
jgi:membrane carboxypeptidase/penicillin-binding protein PbpC